MSEQNFTILEPTNGMMPLIIPLARKSYSLGKQRTFNNLIKFLFREISHYSVALTTDSAFVIGGYKGSCSDVIAQFKNMQWSLYGNLKKRRDGHRSITFGSQTMVIGGYTDDGS